MALEKRDFQPKSGNVDSYVNVPFVFSSRSGGSATVASIGGNLKRASS